MIIENDIDVRDSSSGIRLLSKELSDGSFSIKIDARKDVVFRMAEFFFNKDGTFGNSCTPYTLDNNI